MDISEKSAMEDMEFDDTQSQQEILGEYGAVGREVRNFAGVIAGDYSAFREAERLFIDGQSSARLHYLETVHRVDEEWIRRIEETLPSIERVLASPRFELTEVSEVKRTSDVRKASAASVMDLAQNSGRRDITYNAESNTITPGMLLEKSKEDSDIVYENMFVNTLIRNLDHFVKARSFGLKQTMKEAVTTFELSNEFSTAESEGKYSLSIVLNDNPVELPDEEPGELDFSTDKTMAERIADLKEKIEEDFLEHELIKRLGERNVVKPPIRKTNALLGNKDLSACSDLWDYITSYESSGYIEEKTENTVELSRDAMEELVSLGTFQYVTMRYERDGHGECSEKRDEMRYDPEGLDKSIERDAKAGEGDGGFGGDRSDPVYISRDTLTAAEREILHTLNAALEADIVYNELGILGKENIAGYLGLGMTVEQVRGLAVQTQRRRKNA